MQSFFKKIMFYSLLASTTLSSAFVLAAAPISLKGPKITDKDVPANRDVTYPMDFAIYDFKPGNLGADVVVPMTDPYFNECASDAVAGLANPNVCISSNIVGLHNKDQLSGDSPNTYFNHYYQKTKDYLFQTLVGNYGGDASKKDIAVISQLGFQVCLDYSETGTCAGGIKYYSLFVPDKQIFLYPFHAVSYDHDGVKGDDLAIIAWGYLPKDGGFAGALVLLKNQGNPADPFDTTTLDYYSFKEVPTSITLGDFAGDNKKDVAISASYYDGVTSGIIKTFKNNGLNFDAVIDSNHYPECLIPMSVATYNPDADKDDLVLTCPFSKDASGVKPGLVYVLKNNGSADYEVKQKIDGFKTPWITAVGDLNGDGNDKLDLAVSDYAASQVVTIPGSAAFSMDTANRKAHDLKPYHTHYIQIQDMNADGLNDVVTVSSLPLIPTYRPTVSSDAPVFTPEASKVARFEHKDGVLVLIQERPNISITSPKECGKTEIQVYCSATPGRTISECSVSSVEPWLASAAPVQTADGTNKKLTFNIPASNGTYHYKITAKDDVGNVYTVDGTSTFNACPANVSCPVDTDMPKAEAAGGEDWEICIPQSISGSAVSSGKEIIWNQTDPASVQNIFTDITGKVMAQTAVPSGPCIRGKFNGYKLLFSNYQANLSYEVKGVVGPCPAKVTYLPASLEGQSKNKLCSMGGNIHSFSYISSILLGLWGIPLMTIYSVRRKK